MIKSGMVHNHTAERLAPGALAAHRHTDGYAALVRRGLYYEAAAQGRFRVKADTLVIHPPFHLHSNDIEMAGEVWNVPLPNSPDISWCALQGRTVERLLASCQPPTAGDIFEAANDAEPIDFEALPGWLSDLTQLHGRHFAEAQSEISREHAHRAFRRHFGMPPGRFRREHMLQQAISLLKTPAPLAEIAASAGFADQSHMTRLFAKELGITPARLRLEITPVQDG